MAPFYFLHSNKVNSISIVSFFWIYIAYVHCFQYSSWYYRKESKFGLIAPNMGGGKVALNNEEFMLFSVPNMHLFLSLLSFFKVSLCYFISSGMKLQSLFTEPIWWPARSLEYGVSFGHVNDRNCFKLQPHVVMEVQMVKNPSAHINP